MSEDHPFRDMPPVPIVRVQTGALMAAYQRWGRVTVYKDGRVVACAQMAMSEVVVYRFTPEHAPTFKGLLVDQEA